MLQVHVVGIFTSAKILMQSHKLAQNPAKNMM